MSVVKLAKELSPVVKQLSHKDTSLASRRPLNNASYTPNVKKSSYLDNILGVAETVATFVATKNPYIAGAVLAYEGYQLAKDYFSDDESSQPLSKGTNDSVVNTEPVVKVSPQHPPQVQDYSSAMKHISSSVRSAPSSISSYNGSTLLDILKENSVSTNKINAGLMSALIDAIGIASHHNTVAIEKSAQMQTYATNALNSNMTAVFGDIALSLSNIEKVLTPYFEYETYQRTKDDDIIPSPLTRFNLNTSKYWSFQKREENIFHYAEDGVEDYVEPVVENFNKAKEDSDVVVDETVNETVDETLDKESISGSLDDIVSELSLIGSGISELTEQFSNTKAKDELFIDELEFRSTSKNIVDLDNNEICSISRREVENIKNATFARKVTDENNFELDDEDFDDDLGDLMPDISAIFGSYNVSDILKEISENGGSD